MCGGSVDGVFVVERVRNGDDYGAVVVAAEETSQRVVGNRRKGYQLYNIMR